MFRTRLLIDAQSNSLKLSDGAHDLNLVDLEFLHNYCTSTALTLHRDPPTIRLWSITVPEFGFIHDYVMHGILALSALHLGYVSLPIHLFTECQTSP